MAKNGLPQDGRNFLSRPERLKREPSVEFQDWINYPCYTLSGWNETDLIWITDPLRNGYLKYSNRFTCEQLKSRAVPVPVDLSEHLNLGQK